MTGAVCGDIIGVCNSMQKFDKDYAELVMCNVHKMFTNTIALPLGQCCIMHTIGGDSIGL